MNETIKAELDKIVSTLAGTGLVTKVILFGSYAKGEETAKLLKGGYYGDN